MSLRATLVKLAKKLEAGWQALDLSSSPIIVMDGWYVLEFFLPGSLQHTPRIIVEGADKKQSERKLSGFHSGRNRMLVYLPAGHLVAFSESIEFTSVARVPAWEGRARVLLICFRYLLDFFSPGVLIRMLTMQFKNPFDLSTELLFFYAPPVETAGYLRDVQAWSRFRHYRKPLAWFYRRIKIAVIIENETQRAALGELLLAPDAILSACQQGKIPAEIDYVIPLASTERLREPALLMIKRAIRKARRANKTLSATEGIWPQLLYTDHDYAFDVSVGQQVMEPVFKPKPSSAYLHCFNYLGPSLVFARERILDVDLLKLLQTEKQYRLALQAFKDVGNVLHIDEVLFNSDRQHTMTTPEPNSDKSFWPDIKWQRGADYNVLQVDSNWRENPSVDLIIPTRDGLDVLQPCVESILRLTDYPNYKIIIADNGSELPETHEFLQSLTNDERVEVVDYPGEFNYSAINNFAISRGSSEYVAMINNDIEVIHADWLSQMMVWVKQPQVGVVGAKLLFANGLVQHAGVIIGMGNAAGHIHRLEDGDALGYQNRCAATQNMMAVTAACLVTPRKLFEQLGGLDAEYLKVAYNDIDYCLRVEQSGLDIIWTPQARLFHHESVSRGDDMSSQHIERYLNELEILQKRWKTKGFVDKYYSKHLRISDEGVYPQVTVTGNDKLRRLV